MRRVGCQNQPVAVPIAAHLIAFGRQPSVVGHRLHLHHAALRNLTVTWSATLYLSGGIEAEIRVSRTLVGKFADAEDLRLERCPDGVEQVGERCIARPLPCRAARSANSGEIGEVGLGRRSHLAACRCHEQCCDCTFDLVQEQTQDNGLVARPRGPIRRTAPRALFDGMMSDS